MKFIVFGTCLGLLVGCGVVVGQHYGGGNRNGETQVPLHEQEFVQDPAEELERKWGFEVSCDVLVVFAVLSRFKS
jgi:agmatinase